MEGGVLKFALVVDIDTTLPDVPTDTAGFSPTILILCGICFRPLLLTPTPAGGQKTIHDK